ncbi:TIGR01777 family oxidoreductase [Bacteriovorax sp. Seq25_V]|uniref:TIGR01777 family oxidoreductase n=1 Tax=Bacteriovorax sp. Seq25_V TaxID=1201288 RepID=UPI00038A53DB|nr:TIGR01777 family oxidoreductase [Bacteriovorax sp. Seq25_V]EQC44056.1 TIGR01777 family protein [Bacteriovorax sp. Seq25_V]
MNLLITGGTGFVGEKLLELLKSHSEISSIFMTTRSPDRYTHLKDKYPKIKFITWDSVSDLPQEELSQIDAVINLQGENISNGRWSEKQKNRIYASRVDATKALVNSVLNHSKNLKVFIQTSAIGIYPSNDNSVINENTQPQQEGFLAGVCKDWEATLRPLDGRCRVVTLRVGVVLDRDGGAIAKMKLPFLMGVGGIIGSGEQLMSWIHRYDLAKIYCEALFNEKYAGVFNAVAPEVVSNYQFTKTLGKTIKRPTIFPVPAFILKLIFGEMSSLLLDSQQVENKGLKDLGHKFQYPTIKQALEEIFP